MASTDETCNEIERQLKLLLFSDHNEPSNYPRSKKKQESKPQATMASSSSSFKSQLLNDQEWPVLGTNAIAARSPKTKRKPQKGVSEKGSVPSSQQQEHRHNLIDKNTHTKTRIQRTRKQDSPQRGEDHPTAKFDNRPAGHHSKGKGRRRERSYSEGESYQSPAGYGYSTRHGEYHRGKNQGRASSQQVGTGTSLVLNNERATDLLSCNATWKKHVENKSRSPMKPIVELSAAASALSTSGPAAYDNRNIHKCVDTSFQSVSPNVQKDDSPDLSSAPISRSKVGHDATKFGSHAEYQSNYPSAAKSSVGNENCRKPKWSDESVATDAKTKRKERSRRSKKKQWQENGRQENYQFDVKQPAAADKVKGTSSGPDIWQYKERPKQQQPSQQRHENKIKEAEHECERERDHLNRPGSGRNRTSARPMDDDSFDNPKFIQKLQEESIEYTKRVTKDGARVVFMCSICEFIAFRAKVIKDHVSHKTHRQKKMLYHDGMPLHKLPPPCMAQVEALTEMIEKIASEQQVSASDMELYDHVVLRLNRILQTEFPECKLQLFGSLAYGLALKGSDVDLNLEVAEGINPAEVFVRLEEILKEQDSFSKVTTDFFAKIPSLECVDATTGIRCHVIWNNAAACSTSALIADYCAIDSRVKKLAIAFRYWAKLCGIDDQKKDMIPSYCYVLMLIHFLQQQVPPVLPILYGLPKMMATPGSIETQERYVSPQNVILSWKTYNQKQLGELWLELFQFYSIKFRYSESVVSIRQVAVMKQNDRKWNARGLAIEDPFLTKRNIARCVSTSTFRYIRETFKISYKYFAIPQLSTGPLFDNLPSEFSKNMANDILDGLCNEAALQEKRKQDRILYETRDEDVDLALLDNNDNEDNGSEKSTADAEDEDDSSSSVLDMGADPLEDHDPAVPFESIVNTMKNANLTDEAKQDPEVTKQSVEDYDADEDDEEDELDEEMVDDADREVVVDGTSAREGTKQEKTPSLLDGIVASMKALMKDELAYKFTEDVFVCGRVPPLYCRHCQRGGHLKQNCPQDRLPDLEPLQPIEPHYIQLLNELFQGIMREYNPGSDELEERHGLLLKLQDYIRDLYKDAKLELFGSSCNGFGFTQSDLDICLTFDAEETGKDLNHAEIIEALAERLKQHKELYGVIPITTAKVPIVKFVHRKTGLDGDISLYNTLAKHNTRMLNTYCNIDQRVRILGYVMKYFAKVCDICDASRGSLSSYAYILMVLYFLQQRNPPVIPVLQELYDKSNPKPEKSVDGWNAWFYDDVENLSSVWPDFKKNTESVGELWLGLLRFYTEEFDFERRTISIRQKAPLSRLTKMWTSSNIAIEDPFNLNHNLGAGVSRKMSHYILSAFVYGRNLFGNPPKWLSSNYADLKACLFDPRFLTDGAPPNDRGCHHCGKIGHKHKDCPRKAASTRGQKHNQNNNNHNQFHDQNNHKKGNSYRKKPEESGKNSSRTNDVVRNQLVGQASLGIDGEQGTTQHTRKNKPGPTPMQQHHHPQQQQQQLLLHQQHSQRGGGLRGAFPVVSAHQSLLTSSMVGSDTHNSGLPCHFGPANLIQTSVSVPSPFTTQALPKLAANLGNKQPSTVAAAASQDASAANAFGQHWPPPPAAGTNREQSKCQQLVSPNVGAALLPRAPVHQFTPLMGPSIPPPFTSTAPPNVRPQPMDLVVNPALHPARQHNAPPTGGSYAANSILFQQVRLQQLQQQYAAASAPSATHSAHPPSSNQSNSPLQRARAIGNNGGSSHVLVGSRTTQQQVPETHRAAQQLLPAPPPCGTEMPPASLHHHQHASSSQNPNTPPQFHLFAASQSNEATIRPLESYMHHPMGSSPHAKSKPS